MGDSVIAAAYRRDSHFLVVQHAILAPVDQFAVPCIAGRQGLPHFRVELRIMLAGFEQFVAKMPDRLRYPIAGQVAESPVNPDDTCLAVGDEHGIGDAIERGIVQAQCLAGARAFDGKGSHCGIILDQCDLIGLRGARMVVINGKSAQYAAIVTTDRLRPTGLQICPACQFA